MWYKTDPMGIPPEYPYSEISNKPRSRMSRSGCRIVRIFSSYGCLYPLSEIQVGAKDIAPGGWVRTPVDTCRNIAGVLLDLDVIADIHFRVKPRIFCQGDEIGAGGIEPQSFYMQFAGQLFWEGVAELDVLQPAIGSPFEETAGGFLDIIRLVQPGDEWHRVAGAFAMPAGIIHPFCQ